MTSMLRRILTDSAITVVVALSAALTASSAVVGQELAPGAKSVEKPHEREKPLSPEREQLRDRFEQRLERLDALKDKNIIGETWQGLVEALDRRLLSKDNRDLVDDENRDRQSLYRLVSEDRADAGKRVPESVVGERNAGRKFEAAGADEYLKISEGRWIQKRDQKRADRIARLKADGVLGETWDGWLEATQRDIDKDVRSLIEAENRERRAMYDEVAGRIDKVNATDIALDAAKEIRQQLPKGWLFKSKDGQWERGRGDDRSGSGGGSGKRDR